MTTRKAPGCGHEGPCGERGGAQLPKAPGTHQSPVGVRAALTPVISGCREQDRHPREYLCMAVRSAPYHANAQLLLEHLLSTCKCPCILAHSTWGNPFLVPQLPAVSLTEATRPPPCP